MSILIYWSIQRIPLLRVLYCGNFLKAVWYRKSVWTQLGSSVNSGYSSMFIDDSAWVIVCGSRCNFDSCVPWNDISVNIMWLCTIEQYVWCWTVCTDARLYWFIIHWAEICLLEKLVIWNPWNAYLPIEKATKLCVCAVADCVIFYSTYIIQLLFWTDIPETVYNEFCFFIRIKGGFGGKLTTERNGFSSRP